MPEELNEDHKIQLEAAYVIFIPKIMQFFKKGPVDIRTIHGNLNEFGFIQWLQTQKEMF